jgi:hypothetical protein
MEQPGSHYRDFHEIWYLNTSWKFVEEFLVSLKSDKDNSYFAWTPVRIYDISLNSSKNEKYFIKFRRENQNTHFMISNFFLKSCLLWDNVEEYGRAGHATDDTVTQRLPFAVG